MAWAAGGCHCGALRFEADPRAVFDSGVCHCSICRRTSGAPMLAWAFLSGGGFRLLCGEPRIYRSSSECERLFCGGCGCQIAYRQPGKAGIGIHVAALDDPEAAEFRPRLHICVSSRLSWVRIADGLPEYPENELPPPSPGS